MALCQAGGYPDTLEALRTLFVLAPVSCWELLTEAACLTAVLTYMTVPRAIGLCLSRHTTSRPALVECH